MSKENGSKPPVYSNSEELMQYLKRDIVTGIPVPKAIIDILHNSGEENRYACLVVKGPAYTLCREDQVIALYKMQGGYDAGAFSFLGKEIDHRALWQSIAKMQLPDRLLEKEKRYYRNSDDVRRKRHVEKELLPWLQKYRLPVAMLVYGVALNGKHSVALFHHADIRPSEAFAYLQEEVGRKIWE